MAAEPGRSFFNFRRANIHSIDSAALLNFLYLDIPSCYICDFLTLRESVFVKRGCGAIAL